jgi:C-terminal processing protease CtpA/Prc
MVNYNRHPNFESYLNEAIKKYKNAESIIFDVRANGGGVRDIINHLAPLIIQPEQSPWVANVARIRSDQYLNEDIESMERKFLYNYHSSHFSEEDRKAIDEFNKVFRPIQKFDKSKFSEPFYMVLKSGEQRFKCPIYILANETSFSAASIFVFFFERLTIFVSVFKGLPNVKIAGKNTDGSSGRSEYFFLKNSNIRIKISTMISFQRDGTTLDGNGTAPDIEIDLELDQVFGKKDTQLEQLVNYIKKLD